MKNRLNLFKEGFIQNYFKNHSITQLVVKWSRNNSLPGFSNVPIFDVVAFIYRELKRESIVTRANSIAFSFFLALFPMLISFFTLIPLVLPLFADYITPFISDDLMVRVNGEIDLSQTVIAQFKVLLSSVHIIPASVVAPLLEFIDSVLFKPRFGLLSVGFFLALYYSSNGMMSMMSGFEKSYPSSFKPRNFITKRLVSIQLTSIMVALVLASVFLIIFGNSIILWVGEFIANDGVISFFITILRWLAVIALYYFGIGVIYRYGPSVNEKFPISNPGTSMATILSLLSSLGFALFVNSPYSKYDSLYGPIGTIMVIMLWIQINAFILLIGFELNASILVNRNLIKIRKDEDENLSIEPVDEEE